MNENIAIVHDYLTAVGGAEMTLKAISQIYPKAPIYTLLADEKTVKRLSIRNSVHESFLKKFPKFLKKKRKILLPLLSVAPETFDLREFKVVITSSGAFSKGVITKPNTINICYCHSPTRFAWDYTHEYLKELSLGNLKNLSARFILNYIRIWDAVSADRVEYFVANSLATKAKIKKYYRKDSTVIYPPVETELFKDKSVLNRAAANKRDSFYLIVSRLSPYKKIDVAVEAFNKLGFKLLVIGTGPEYKKLKALAGPMVKILGYQSREKIINYYKKCQGYILPNEEDFGISAVEAMAAGKPVLALRAGGALETVEEGISGEFFDSPTIEVLAEGAYRLKKASKSYDSKAIQERAQRFSKQRFQQEIKQFILSKL